MLYVFSSVINLTRTYSYCCYYFYYYYYYCNIERVDFINTLKEVVNVNKHTQYGHNFKK